MLAGETLLPIQDGVQFPPGGGEAIAGTTAEGAQSQRLHVHAAWRSRAPARWSARARRPAWRPALALAAGSRRR